MALTSAAKVADEAVARFGGSVARVADDIAARAADFARAVGELRNVRGLFENPFEGFAPNESGAQVRGLILELLSLGYTNAEQVKALMKTVEGIRSAVPEFFQTVPGFTPGNVQQNWMINALFRTLLQAGTGKDAASLDSDDLIRRLTAEIRSGQGGPLVAALQAAMK